MKTFIKRFFLAFVPYSVFGALVGLLVGVKVWQSVVVISSMIVLNMLANVLTELSKEEKRAKIEHLKNGAARQK